MTTALNFSSLSSELYFLKSLEVESAIWAIIYILGLTRRMLTYNQPDP